MDGKIGRDRSDFEAGGPSRFPAVRIYAFAFIRFHGFTVLRGKAFPLVGTSLPTHPLLRGDPATPPESSSAGGFSVTG